MSAVVAIVLMLLIVAALIGFCIVNAVRIARHLNSTLTSFRTRLEDEANSVVDALLDQPDDRPPHSANGSPSATSD
jgi:hypothetical protein